MLEGRTEADEAVRLRREIAGLEKELQEARDGETKAKTASADAIHAIRALRKELEPFYNALRMIFGEISRVDAGKAGETTAMGTSGANSRAQVVYEKWISQLGGNRAAIIKALLEHGQMTRQQLRVASSVPDGSLNPATSELYKLGLINRGGGKYSLKEL
jgi:hypothetical protein